MICILIKKEFINIEEKECIIGARNVALLQSLKNIYLVSFDNKILQVYINQYKKTTLYNNMIYKKYNIPLNRLFYFDVANQRVILKRGE